MLSRILSAGSDTGILSESNVMLKIKTLLSVAVAVSGAALASNCVGQAPCSSCAQANFAPAQVAPVQFAPVQIGAPCGPAPAVAPVTFVQAAPQIVGDCGGGGCGGGGCLGKGGHLGGGCLGGGCLGGAGGGIGSELKAKCAHQRAINQKITARNDAWPKPFACADRQLYNSFWGPQIQQGWEEQCVLEAAHFNPETGQLNKFGQQAVAGIMQNNPEHRRTVFIRRDPNDSINEIRRSTVQDTINTFYGRTTNAQVAFSSKRPVTTSGARALQIQEEWFGAQATPAIQVGTGESVSSSVTQ